MALFRASLSVLWVNIIGALVLDNVAAAARHLARQNWAPDCTIYFEPMPTATDGHFTSAPWTIHCSGHTTRDMTGDRPTSILPSFTSIPTLSTTSHPFSSLPFVNVPPTKTPTPPSPNSTGHLTRTSSSGTTLGSAAHVTTKTSIIVFTPSASAKSPPSSLPQASNEGKLAVTAIALGATVGALLICPIILLSLCYWRRARREARFMPKPFLSRQSTMSPNHDALLEGAFTKERIIQASPAPDRSTDESHGSQESTMVNEERDESEEAVLRRENERLRQENELLRLVARQETRDAKLYV